MAPLLSYAPAVSAKYDMGWLLVGIHMREIRRSELGTLKRVGLVLLSDDRTSEGDFQIVFTPLGVRVHSARMWRDKNLPYPERFDRMHDELATATKYVAEGGLDAVAYTCTTGSFYIFTKDKIIDVK